MDDIHRARRAVCHYADDADEAEQLMRMLGIHPDDEDIDMVRNVRTPYSLNKLVAGGWE